MAPPFRVKQEKPELKEPEELKATEDWRGRKERRAPEVTTRFYSHISREREREWTRRNPLKVLVVVLIIPTEIQKINN